MSMFIVGAYVVYGHQVQMSIVSCQQKHFPLVKELLSLAILRNYRWKKIPQ